MTGRDAAHDDRAPSEGVDARPARRVFLTAEWRYLVMLNYTVDPAVLAPLVPAGTELDLYRGAAIATMVGFRFLRTRLLGVAVPGHADFDEVNLRFYVRHTTPAGEVRRGTTFVREIVPRALVARTARLCYNEPYLALPMRSTAPRVPDDPAPGRLAYTWRGGGRDPRRWHTLEATVAGPAAPLAAGSEEEFVAEHYWGYTRQRDGGTVEYQVRHPRWRAWPATVARLDADVAGLYGAAFAGALGAAPRSAFAAEGSPVQVYFPRRLGR